MPKMSFWLGLVLCLVLGASAASAFAPALNRAYEVPLPQAMIAPTVQQLSGEEAARLLPNWNAFSSTKGREWIVAQYRSDLGLPSALIGPGIPLIEATAGDEAIQEAARGFVAQNAAMLKVDPAQLGRSEVLDIGDLRQILLYQQYQGLEVFGGRVDVYVYQGKVTMLNSDFYPGVSLSTTPSLDQERARQAAVSGMPFNPVTDTFLSAPRLLVYPLILDGQARSYLAYEVRFSTADPLGEWTAYVDAGDGQILSRMNDIATFDIPVTVTSDIQQNYQFDPYTNLPYGDFRVAQGANTYYTDGNGFVNVPVPTQGPYTITADLRGRYCDVNRTDGNAAFSGSGTPGVPLSINWTDANSNPDERDAYYSVNRVHSWIKSVDPSFTAMDSPMPTNVNINDPAGCNAYWTSNGTLNFYRAAGGCVNMAQISDVVMHEYGHGITQYTYSPQAPPNSSGMGEAFGDIIAQTNTNDRYMGRGMYNGTGYIRDGGNLRQYPGTECGGEVHCLGEILMGAMWKTRVNMTNTLGYAAGKAKYDQIFRTAHKQKKTSMPSFLLALLQADDNNGTTSDGTPDWYDICDAFALHNIPCPAITSYVQFTHTPLADQSGTTNPYNVVSLIQAVNAGTLLPDSLRLFYSLDQGQNWTNVLLTPTGNPNEYHANIPAQGCGSLVYYYLWAKTSTGAVGTEPARAPLKNVDKFMVGSISAVFDDYESDHGWTVGAPGDAATEGFWERGVSVGKTDPYSGEIVQPYTDHTADPGANCFVTDKRGGYYLNYDVDGGATTLLSPVYDWASNVPNRTGKIDFWAFFANELVIDDTLRCSVSNDGGANWTDLVKVAGMNQNEWKHYAAYFTSNQIPFTNQMRFRFQIADFNASLTEGAIDDVTIGFTNCSDVAVDPASAVPARFEVQQNQPNPARGATNIRFGLPAAGAVSVEIFDVGGRLVRTVSRESLAAGYHSVTWDGRDDHGREAAAGLYYYRVTAGDQAQASRMILVK